ncbi:hypothetical protein [Parasphingorhabdus sp.]|uniref:hypothetical protein n=1 Tax=Parasphingorhabdus sp. TaxID=2709688 RepID=UPI0032EC7522
MQSDGDCIRGGTAKTYSIHPESILVGEDVEEALIDTFMGMLESYFESCERLKACSFGE